MNIRIIKTCLLASAIAGVAAIPAPAFAQNAPDTSARDDADSAEEIIVTGTLIRGIAPGGSQSIGVSQEKIVSIGAANTSDLVSAIPQAGTFNQYVGVRGSSNFSLAVNRPILRDLGFSSSSTASTLLLLDGHRLPGMGITQSSADVDAIAAGAIERVEVVTDGGSSTYGSDAVGGVINFITRKNFDGVEVKANYGFGDNYDQINATATVGKTWEGGSAYVSYDFSRHDPLFGADRDWWQSLDWPRTAAAGAPVGSFVNCVPGNVVFGATTLGLTGAGGTSTTVNRCDNSELATFYPREKKHSVLASISLDNGGPWSFSVKGYYVNRVSTSDAGPLTADIAVPQFLADNVTPNPVYLTVAGQTGNQTARISFAPLLGNSVPQVTKMNSWGVTPSVKVDLGEWQVNAFVNYGRGKSTFSGGLINTTPLVAAARAGTFNPFNLSAPGNAATVATATDWFQVGRAVHDMLNSRIVADGPLLKMPGGDLRVALGAEFLQEKYSGFTSRSITAAGFAAAPDFKVKRDVWSVFGEVNLPIVGADNRGAIHGLSLTASGRFDHYSDFGNTFNPKIGINFEPTDWLRLRGNWGKAFQAPGMSDLAAVLIGGTITPLNTAQRPFFNSAVPPPVTPGDHNGFILAFGGTKAGLQPQKAKTWSLGFDIKPQGSGFEGGITYYNIQTKDTITFASINAPSFFQNFANNSVLFNAAGGGAAGEAAMLAYFNQLAASLPGGATGATALNAITNVGGSFANVYGVYDGTTSNVAVIKTSGLDVYTRYTHQTGFGDIYVDMAGTLTLTLSVGGPTGVVDVNGLDPRNEFKLNTTIGTHIGNFQAQATWAHNAGMTVAPTAANLQQNRVDRFDLINLFFQYKFPGDSNLMKDLALTLNIDNVFDKDPPLFRGSSNSLFGAGNGFTLGRIVKIGVSKKF
jgi:iron complex outermembrane recepter protein